MSQTERTHSLGSPERQDQTQKGQRGDFHLKMVSRGGSLESDVETSWSRGRESCSQRRVSPCREVTLCKGFSTAGRARGPVCMWQRGCKKTDLKSAGCFGAKDRRKITENDALSPHRAKTMLWALGVFWTRADRVYRQILHVSAIGQRSQEQCQGFCKWTSQTIELLLPEISWPVGGVALVLE